MRVMKKGVKYGAYLLTLAIGAVLILFGFQANSTKSELVSEREVPDFVGDRAYADHGGGGGDGDGGGGGGGDDDGYGDSFGGGDDWYGQEIGGDGDDDGDGDGG